MGDPGLWLFYGVWIGGSAVAALIGRAQGRNPLTCFVASVVLTPVLAIPGLLWLGRRRARIVRREDPGAPGEG